MNYACSNRAGLPVLYCCGYATGSYEESKTILIVIPLLFVFEVSLYAVRIKHGTVLQREYIKKEGERIDFTNAGLNSRAVMLRYNQIEPAGQKFDALHSAEMWARFQFLLYNFNTAYLGRLVPVLMYALCMNVMGNQALSKDSEVKIGDVVLVLSTLTGFSSSIGSLANRLAKVGRGFLGVQILAEFFNLPSILDASLQTTRLDNDKEPCSTSNLSLAEQNKNAELHEALRKEQEQKPLDEQEVVVKNAMFDIDLKTEGVQSYAYNVVLKQGTFSLLLGAEGSGESVKITWLSLFKLAKQCYHPQLASFWVHRQDDITQIAGGRAAGGWRRHLHPCTPRAATSHFEGKKYCPWHHS